MLRRLVVGTFLDVQARSHGRTLRRAITASGTGLVTLVAACADGTTVESSPVVSALPVDPVAQLVGSAPGGALERVQDQTSDRETYVRVLREYDAASGRVCREFAIAGPRAMPQTRRACRQGSVWEIVWPLQRQTSERDTSLHP